MPSHPAVGVNDNTIFLPKGRRIRVLQVSVPFSGPPQEVTAFGREVVGRVLDAHQDLSAYDSVRVVVRRQAVLGIGFLSRNHIEPVPVGSR